MVFNYFNSTEDASVNFVQQTEVGFVEARYVRRSDDRFIIYLSSQTGCNKGCKFCHLTATKQTKYIDVSPDLYMAQAERVMEYYKTQKSARVVHYNFMARGEVLDNPNIFSIGQAMLTGLNNLAIKNHLIPKINISTIMPKIVEHRSLSKVFAGVYPTIYYSLYSMNPEFRKKWLPRAMDPELALDKLQEYQEDSKKIIKLHWAFIENENDSFDDIAAICKAVKERKLQVEINIVRYNPHSYKYGKESDINNIHARMEDMEDLLGCKVKMIDRVGFDVKASCGMFV